MVCFLLGLGALAYGRHMAGALPAGIRAEVGGVGGVYAGSACTAAPPREEKKHMSRMWFTAVVFGAVVFGMSGAVHAQDVMTILGSGSGAHEAPQVGTAAVGTATCTLNRIGASIACTARVHNLVDLRDAHLHVAGPGVAGPVVLPIPGLPRRASDDFALSWTWTQSDLVLRPAQGVLKMLDVFEACSSGNCYLNFHTTANPAGELRIDLCPAGAEQGRSANPFFGINVCVPHR